MNKHQFMTTLKKHLAQLPPDEKNELLSEYENHFLFAMQNGKSEEDIVKELGDPIELAKEAVGDRYIEPTPVSSIGVESSRTVFSTIMLVFVNMFMLPILFSIWCVVLSLGVSGVAGVVSPILVAIDSVILHHFYLAKLFASITFVGFGILLLFATYYASLGMWKVTKSYFRWNIATVRGK